LTLVPSLTILADETGGRSKHAIITDFVILAILFTYGRDKDAWTEQITADLSVFSDDRAASAEERACWGDTRAVAFYWVFRHHRAQMILCQGWVPDSVGPTRMAKDGP